MKQTIILNIGKRLVILFFIGLMSVQSLCAQSPNCEQCDAVIDDPVAYAECVDQNCSDAIPVDQHLWILIMAGSVAVAYALNKNSPFITRLIKFN